MRNWLTPKSVLAAAIVLTSLPFIDQAFHIDDRIYLSTADNILQSPLFPYDYPLYFEGRLAKDMASHSHLPLTSYYLALVKAVTGSEREWIYHVAFLVFPVIAVFSFYDMARRYVRNGLAATLIFIGSPAFLVLSHTLMPDVPLLALWLLSLSRVLRITSGEGDNRDRIVLVTAVMGAAFMSLLTVGLLLLITAYLGSRFWNSLPLHHRGFWLLLLGGPVLLWFFWYTRAYLHYDRMVLATVFLYVKNERVAFDWSELGLRFLSFVLNSGSVLLFPLAIWTAFHGRHRTRIALLLFALSLLWFWIFVEGWSFVHTALFALFCSSGVLVIWEFVALIKDGRPERRLLFLWYFGILTACLLLYFNGSARYVLLVLPPVVLLWVKHLETRVKDRYLVRNILGTTVLMSALYAGLASYADYHFAEIYRKNSSELYSDYKTEESHVWIAGEWGFRYYMEREGARLLPRTSQEPVPGDIIIKPFVAFPWVTLYDGDPMTSLLEQRIHRDEIPLRIMDFSSHAGFYSTGWGLLPMSLSTGEPWEWFNVYRVEQEYSGPAPQEQRWW